MTYFDTINYKKTIEKNRIVFASYWFDLIETIMFYLFITLAIASILLMYSNADVTSPNDSLFAFFIAPLILLFIGWMVYKKNVEKRLLVINTSLNTKKARGFILEYVKSNGWNIYKNNSQYISATTDNGISFGKVVTIIYGDNKILLNVMSNNPKIRRPVFLSDKSIKKQIEKALNIYTNEPTR